MGDVHLANILRGGACVTSPGGLKLTDFGCSSFGPDPFWENQKGLNGNHGRGPYGARELVARRINCINYSSQDENQQAVHQILAEYENERYENEGQGGDDAEDDDHQVKRRRLDSA